VFLSLFLASVTSNRGINRFPKDNARLFHRNLLFRFQRRTQKWLCSEAARPYLVQVQVPSPARRANGKPCVIRPRLFLNPSDRLISVTLGMTRHLRTRSQTPCLFANRLGTRTSRPADSCALTRPGHLSQLPFECF